MLSGRAISPRLTIVPTACQTSDWFVETISLTIAQMTKIAAPLRSHFSCRRRSPLARR